MQLECLRHLGSGPLTQNYSALEEVAQLTHRHWAHLAETAGVPHTAHKGCSLMLTAPPQPGVCACAPCSGVAAPLPPPSPPPAPCCPYDAAAQAQRIQPPPHTIEHRAACLSTLHHPAHILCQPVWSAVPCTLAWHKAHAQLTPIAHSFCMASCSWLSCCQQLPGMETNAYDAEPEGACLPLLGMRGGACCAGGCLHGQHGMCTTRQDAHAGQSLHFRACASRYQGCAAHSAKGSSTP